MHLKQAILRKVAETPTFDASAYQSAPSKYMKGVQTAADKAAQTARQQYIWNEFGGHGTLQTPEQFAQTRTEGLKKQIAQAKQRLADLNARGSDREVASGQKTLSDLQETRQRIQRAQEGGRQEYVRSAMGPYSGQYRKAVREGM